eukprot:CAMPEP_0176342732 /NCGR_PEP_ID=MMETSP0126-20121128/3407_1 /TAXON_ID=141414 ORGANISM="Strombidinopsis acuminatum, Strain SPMC142" /NCGR_SAMPLE_ID=MMETSP0126 /ASSEMBLY_ACC=CAM_ASM_000229 /LENGTH=37 /DNA_ID= /DNA_START= /DNA_END= /DNA_ORIENTATION=
MKQHNFNIMLDSPHDKVVKDDKTGNLSVVLIDNKGTV